MRSICEDEVCNICVGSLRTWCNTNRDVIFSTRATRFCHEVTLFDVFSFGWEVGVKIMIDWNVFVKLAFSLFKEQNQ